MCGRYTLKTPVDLLWKHFALGNDVPEKFMFLTRPRYNVAPSQEILTIVYSENPTPQFMHWGMLPLPQVDEGKPKHSSSIINARAETLFEKAMFQEAAKYNRCLIPADGFYEWQNRDGQKTPLHFVRKDDQPFAFAGIWHERVLSSGENSFSCAIVTTRANKLMRRFHHRMPVILAQEEQDLWLNPLITTADHLNPLLTAQGAEDIVAYEVSKMVNSSREDIPEMILPVSPASYQMGLFE
ncbi:MAG: SOS response-associated peptidase [SAR202 cluster bacterium]|nr:SOS response-associated peptidase [SAR202 cluster bacterium]|tara:strand:+ start:5201 stop:5920 length:720 start_codon:yes stop_codon:yes gene_type:complete